MSAYLLSLLDNHTRDLLAQLDQPDDGWAVATVLYYELDEAKANITRLTLTVREVHRKDDHPVRPGFLPVCRGCWCPWPCPTETWIRALPACVITAADNVIEFPSTSGEVG